MERKECLLSELPEELRDVYNHAAYLLGHQQGTVGFTFGGVRYRVYSDETARASADVHGFCDLTDALKGGDLPAEKVQAAMDRLEFSTTDQNAIWKELTKLQSASERSGGSNDLSN